MPGMNNIQDVLDQSGNQGSIGELERQAGPRGYTYAGRSVQKGQGQTLQSILARPPMGEMESGGIGMQAGSMFMGGMAGKLGSKAIEDLIHQRAQLGLPMKRGSFIPTITLPGKPPLLGSVGGIHGDIPLPANIPQGTRSGFATVEGHQLPDAALHLLTGPPEKLKAASAMLKNGATLQDMLNMIAGKMPIQLKPHGSLP